MTIVGTTTYQVETVYSVTDKASRGLSDIDKHAKSAASSAEGLSSMLKGVGVALLGGAGISAAKHAFIDFNSTVQDTKSQIAGMLALASKTSFVDNLGRADMLFANLQKRAASLPGTTQEYANMMGSITQPIINAGLGMKALEDLTVNSVVAAKALHVEAGAAARDIDQALRGQYHSVDVFTGKLLSSIGYAGEAGRAKYNALSGDKRASELQRGIMQPQIAEMAAAQGASFTGVLSTLQDNFQQLGGRIGLPLFKKVTDEIVRWNTWLDKNSVKVDHIVDSVSKGLVSGFEMAKNAMAWIVDHADTLLSIGKVWAGIKIAEGLGGSLSGIGAGLKGAISGGAATATMGSVGALVQVGAAAYLVTTELMKLTGATDHLRGLIDPQRAEYEKLKVSMDRWDDALAQSRRDLQGAGQTGLKATNTYANMQGAVGEVGRELKDAEDAKAARIGGYARFLEIADGLTHAQAMARSNEHNHFTNPEAAKEDARIEKLRNERDSTKQRSDLADSIASKRINEVMSILTPQQKSLIDMPKMFEAVMSAMVRALAGDKAPLNFAEVRDLILNLAHIEKNDFGQGKPNTTNINIAHLEVAAKDPDRWILDLDAAAKRHVNAPKSARSAIRGR